MLCILIDLKLSAIIIPNDKGDGLFHLGLYGSIFSHDDLIFELLHSSFLIRNYNLKKFVN